ncbi:MAG: shikimate dehydrogenase [Gammaproteobacteria bacterium]|jgi:shikimate dehydrogenase|nr:shikimate dehydrogenase [Gammaproteobacteria bacterium]
MSLFDFDAPPDRYAVMGNPVSHSLSPRIHAEFARRTRQRLVYDAIQVDEGGFAQAVGNFQAAGGKGLNVTVPFKQQAWSLVTRRSPRAERAGAVNTIRMDRDGSLFGDNTDGAGLVRDLRENLGLRLEGVRILLIGAGGAARGALEPLLEERPAELTIANRNVDRAEELVRLFAGAPLHACGFGGLEGRRFDVVINATSASLHGEALPLPSGLLAPGAWCYDMMYAAEPTPFLRWAEAQGAAGLRDGLGMLVEQAAESFSIWRGVRPETEGLVDELRLALRARVGG